jgi:hypothetical protein
MTLRDLNWVRGVGMKEVVEVVGLERYRWVPLKWRKAGEIGLKKEKKGGFGVEYLLEE